MKRILSCWRKAHFALALVSSAFLIITSVTGVILSFEPVSNRLHESHIGNASNSSIGALIEQVESSYMEVIEVKVDENSKLNLSVIDMEGEFLTFLANPNTGKKVEEARKEHPVYAFSRKLHRSLFFGWIGRLTIGITSFLLFFIAVSGIILIAQRQLGWKKFFSKVDKDNVYTYWHVIFGRWSFPLLMIIALTGIFLSMERFELFPEEVEIKHEIDFNTLTDTPVLEKRKFEIFKSTHLSDLESIQFPFSPDLEDYYHIRLRDRELIVNQFNGKIISEVEFDETQQLQDLAFNLHTGKTSAIWSVILGIGSLGILFFVFTGLKIALRRRRSPKKNTFTKSESSIVILVGSEGGETMLKAEELKASLIKSGESVYLDRLNNYEVYEKMQHLLIFTSTYGDGQAPNSANRFLEKFSALSQMSDFTFSIVGFGSKNYLQFCKFAEDVYYQLKQNIPEKTPLVRINEQSVTELNDWLSQWSDAMNLSIPPFKSVDEKLEAKRSRFLVIENSANTVLPGESFQLALKSSEVEFRSGDLLAIQPNGHSTERFYSIGKNKNGELFLSVKLHEDGACSTELSRCFPGDQIEARVQENESFHFPSDAQKIICISNGTGIAPFIGMANENSQKIRLDVYWGSRFQPDLEMYQEEIDHVQSLGQLASFQFALSREGDENYTYVQDLIRGDANSIAASLNSGAVIMICGSVAMRDDVIRVLGEICQDFLEEGINFFIEKGQIKSDCY